ncbi:MAG: hypothetical protein IJI45_16535 [Anaerolineaceae bacterium]|nr:hypothetical protein [Anaerolineaceae bacterium]
MNSLIRRGCFETNSSSVHAIIIQKQNVKPYLYEGQILFIEHHDFGWSPEYFSEPSTLASYYCEWLIHSSYDEDKGKWKKRITERLNNFADIMYKNGVTVDFPEDYIRFNGWGGLVEGYIDHVSELDEFFEPMEHHEKRLLTYIFGPENYIETGNDNSDNAYPSMDNPEGTDLYVKGN